ncbi:MAG: hypothetical protein AAFX40_13475 [Cyanobacteria bacterium J06639_1]
MTSAGDREKCAYPFRAVLLRSLKPRARQRHRQDIHSSDMQTIEQTSAKLVVRNYPDRTTYIVVGLLLTPWIGFCLYLMAGYVDFSTRVIQIDCDRTSPKEAQCVVRRSRLLGLISQPSKTRTYRRVTGAFFRSRRDRNEEGAPTVDRWIALRTPAGEIPAFDEFPLVDSLATTRRMSAIAADINRILLSESSSRSLQYLPNWDGLNLVFAFGIYGLMLASVIPFAYAMLGSEVVVFDRESHHIQSIRQTILGKRMWCLTFEQVRRIEICDVGEDGYAIALVLADGRQRQLLSLPNRSSVEATRDVIRETLRLP